MTMSKTESEDRTVYKVVVNHEEQYSIWPDYKEVPAGWKPVGKAGVKSECLHYIKDVWTDMRPLSLRKKMEEFAKNPPPLPQPTQSTPRGESLVDRLCAVDHLVEVGLRPEKTARSFKEAIDRNYVHIKFLQTKGGTELGFHLDQNTLVFNEADFENGMGSAHVEGTLILDYVRVKCVADIDLGTLQGKGRLVKLDLNEPSPA
jgi:uncharacterized protein YbdZ (MbtH family)